MQTITDFTILSSNSLHVSINDESLLKENIRAQIKPGNRILILALSGIGDALMFTPALTILKRSFPNNDIEILNLLIRDISKIKSSILKQVKLNFFGFRTMSSIS